MSTAEYIDALLYRYQCVVVPSFGAFLTQIKPAYLQKESRTFYPPSKALSFNSQLQGNDGLLVNHIAQAEDKSFEEVMDRLSEEVRQWNRALRTAGELELPPLGVFKKDAGGRLHFNPREKSNYLTASFGLSPVLASPVIRETLKEEVEALEQRIPFSITPEERSTPGIRPYLKYAAVILLALSAGISGYSFYQQQQALENKVWADTQKQVTRNIQEATFFSSEPIELPAVTLEIQKKSQKMHHIIAGAFRIRENADKKIRQLQQKGYQARYIGLNAYGLHQVAYGSYANADEALEALRQIKRTISPDAWLLSQK